MRLIHPLPHIGQVHLLTPPDGDRHRDNYCLIKDNSDIVDLFVSDRTHDRAYLSLATDD